MKPTYQVAGMNTAHAFEGFRAQTWNDQELLSDIAGLSIDAAREIARAALMTRHTGRIMAEGRDYCEVYTAEGTRRGTWAETTIVRVRT